MWFWLSLIALLCWSGSDLFSKIGCQSETDKYSHLKMVTAVGVVMGLHAAYEIFIGGTQVTWEIIWTYLPVSLLYISSMAMGYIGLRYIELSISSPICNSSGALVAVLCLIGRCDLAWGSDNPFTTADRLLKAGEKPTFTLVDFHAQATSEKLAMAYYLDGRVSALWGTHTHVPTADERVFPHGTGYITDLGMTGPVESVLGVEPWQSVEHFLGGLPGRYRSPEGPCKLQGAVFTVDTATGLCTAVERVDVR